MSPAVKQDSHFKSLLYKETQDKDSLKTTVDEAVPHSKSL